MKRTLLFALLASYALYSQFSSGVDYSAAGAGEKLVGNFSAGVILETGESEWEINYGSDQKFRAASELFAAGYTAGAEKEFGKFNAGIEIEHIFKNYSNSASGDSAGVNFNLDPEDTDNSRFSAVGTISLNGRYGFDLSAVSFSDGDESILIPGAGLNYTKRTDGGSVLSATFKMNFYKTEDAPAGYFILNEPDPHTFFKAGYKKTADNREFGLEFRYYSFDDAGEYISSVYLGGEAFFGYDFKKAGSSIRAAAGGNLNGELDLPELRLPFFYYEIVYSNTIIKDRLSVQAGWKHGFYSSDLRNRAEFSALIPAEISSEEIIEKAGESRLYLTLVYNY